MRLDADRPEHLVMTALIGAAVLACAAVSTRRTRGEVYDDVRPASCARIQRCAPAQFAREYPSVEACLVANRPRWPRSAEQSDCDVDACNDAQNEKPCTVLHVVECEGC